MLGLARVSTLFRSFNPVVDRVAHDVSECRPETSPLLLRQTQASGLADHGDGGLSHATAQSLDLISRKRQPLCRRLEAP